MLGVITAGARIRNGEIEVAAIESADKKEDIKACAEATEIHQKTETKNVDAKSVDDKKKIVNNAKTEEKSEIKVAPKKGDKK